MQLLPMIALKSDILNENPERILDCIPEVLHWRELSPLLWWMPPSICCRKLWPSNVLSRREFGADNAGDGLS